MSNVGDEMYDLAKLLFPICRSITGNGVRETFGIIQNHIPLKVYEVPTGTSVFDWTVPKEWNIRSAYLADKCGNKIIDFENNNLHVMGYSVPVNKTISNEELQKHLHSLPEQPNAIPYVTSYYREDWGICLTHSDREKLKDAEYSVFIDSDLKDGSLTYGELIIPGDSEKEVLISTNICHPSLANNELSGPVVAIFLAKWLLNNKRKYTYRFMFVPETIGAICYLSKNLEVMRKNTIAGFNLSCVGDDKKYSYIPTKYDNTYTDKVIFNVLTQRGFGFTKHSFLERGSDERQFNFPGVDLPIVCVCRSKFNTYAEYHTSLDDLSFISPAGLFGSYELLSECISVIEGNKKYKVTCVCEPQLGKRNLCSSVSTKFAFGDFKVKLTSFLLYADGTNDLIDISNKTNITLNDLLVIVEKLLEVNLISEVT